VTPLDPATPAGRAAEASLNAVLASVARRRERERRLAEQHQASGAPAPLSKPA